MNNSTWSESRDSTHVRNETLPNETVTISQAVAGEKSVPSIILHFLFRGVDLNRATVAHDASRVLCPTFAKSGTNKTFPHLVD